jgi:hypothetical protein
MSFKSEAYCIQFLDDGIQCLSIIELDDEFSAVSVCKRQRYAMVEAVLHGKAARFLYEAEIDVRFQFPYGRDALVIRDQ